jgi:tetratricopeptide (TPR) repeat protein
MICPTCKTENLSHYKFCFECGETLAGGKSRQAKVNEKEIQQILNSPFALEFEELIDRAAAYYQVVIEQHPQYADVRFKLGSAYEAKGELDEAIHQYKEAARINPNYIDAHRKLGELYSDKGIYEEAIQEFKKVLKIKIKYRYADVQNNLGVAYEKAGKLKRAIQCYKKALAINQVSVCRCSE